MVQHNDPVTDRPDDYSSALGRAIALIRAGYSLPRSLVLGLQEEQGYTALEINSLIAAHSPR